MIWNTPRINPLSHTNGTFRARNGDRRMISQIAGALLGGAVGKERDNNPVAGAIIGTATMMVARRLLPARFAGMGAMIAAGYVSKKLKERADRRAQAQDMLQQTREGGRIVGSAAPVTQSTVIGADATPVGGTAKTSRAA